MSDFVSVHDVVFGNRPSIVTEIVPDVRIAEYKDRPLETSIDIRLSASEAHLAGMPGFDDPAKFGENRRTIREGLRADEKRVDIQLVASAAELAGIFWFDDFGRFGLANETQACKILDELKVYGRLCAFNGVEEIDLYKTEISDKGEFSEWHMFGWLIGELPDFEKYYDQWKSEHNPSGTEPILKRQRLENPRKNNTIWDIADGLIRAVISEHLLSHGKTTQDIVDELISDKNSTETMRLLKELQRVAPDFIDMDEKTFRIKLKEIFNK